MSIGAIALVTLASMGKAHAKAYELDPKVTSYTAGPLTLSVTRIEASKTDFVMTFQLKNEANTGLILQLQDAVCWRGEQRANFKHAQFGIGERTIDLQPGETKPFNMVCEHSAAAGGSYGLGLLSVWDNPSNDGRTPRDRVLTDVLWRIEDSQLDRELQQSGKAKVTASHIVPSAPAAAAASPAGTTEPAK